MKIKVRGWIENNSGEVFLLRDAKSGFYMLPGGTFEEDKDFSILECLKREIYEELGIIPEIHECLCVRELKNLKQEAIIDFIFLIKNYEKFFFTKKPSTTYSYEYTDFGFFSQKKINLSGIKTLPEDIFSIKTAGSYISILD